MALNEEKDFVIIRFVNIRKRMEKGDDFLSVLQVAAGNFANHEWVGTAFLRIQQCHSLFGLRK